MTVLIVLLVLAIPVAFFVGLTLASREAVKTHARHLNKIDKLREELYSKQDLLRHHEEDREALERSLADACMSVLLITGELMKNEAKPSTVINQYMHTDEPVSSESSS